MVLEDLEFLRLQIEILQDAHIQSTFSPVRGAMPQAKRKRVFDGSSAVTCLVQSTGVDREEALSIGQRLVDAHFLQAVIPDHLTFDDQPDAQYYCTDARDAIHKAVMEPMFDAAMRSRRPLAKRDSDDWFDEELVVKGTHRSIRFFCMLTVGSNRSAHYLFFFHSVEDAWNRAVLPVFAMKLKGVTSENLPGDYVELAGPSTALFVDSKETADFEGWMRALKASGVSPKNDNPRVRFGSDVDRKGGRNASMLSQRMFSFKEAGKNSRIGKSLQNLHSKSLRSLQSNPKVRRAHEMSQRFGEQASSRAQALADKYPLTIPRKCSDIRCQHVVFLLFVLGCLLTIILVPGMGVKECHGPVNCAVCPDATSASNDIAGLPRYNFRLEPVSHNLGEFDLIQCSNETCSAVDLANLGNEIRTGKSSGGSFANYVESMAMYYVFAVLMVVLTTLTALCCCCARYICCCCCKGGCLGKNHPTEKKSLLGFTYNKTTETYSYPCCGFWGAKVYMAVFVFFVFLFVGMGHLRGNVGMTEALKEVADSPSGLVTVLRSLESPLVNLVNNMVGGVVVNFIKDVNVTFSEEVSLRTILDSVVCVVDVIQGLPSLDVLLGFVVTALAAVDDIVVAIDELPSAVGNLSAQADLIADDVDVLLMTNNETIDKLAYVKSNITAIKADMIVLSNFTDELLNGTNGIPAIVADLNAMAITPTDSEFSNAIDDLVNWPSRTADSNHRDAMRLSLGIINASYSSHPNASVTANNMELFNTNLQRAEDDQLANNVVMSINATSDALATLNGTTARFNSTIEAMLTRVRQFDFTAVRNVLYDVEDALESMPNFTLFIDEISKVRVLEDALPCLVSMSEEVSKMDARIIGLPGASLEFATSLPNTLNSTLQPALESVDAAIDNIEDFEDQQTSINMTSRHASLNAMENETRASADAVETGPIMVEMLAAEDASTLNSSVSAEILEFDSALRENKINQTVIDELRQYEVRKQDMLIHIAQVFQNLAAADRIALTGRECEIAESICNDDSDCPLTEMCTYDPSRSGQLIAELSTLRVLPSPDASSAQTALDAVEAAADAIDVSALDESIKAADDAIATISNGDFTVTLIEMREALREFNGSAAIESVNSVSEAVNDFDFSFIEEQLDSMNSTFQEIQNKTALVKDVEQVVEVLIDFLYVELPVFLDRLDEPALTAAYDEGGMTAMVSSMTNVLDDMVSFLANGSDLLAGQLSINVTELWESSALFPSMYRVTSDEYAEHGPLYYLISAAPQENGSSLVVHHGPQEYRLTTGSDGEPYPDGQFCVTTKCINAEIDFINKRPLDEVSQGLIPLPFSRETALGLPFLWPFFTAIFALMALAFFCQGFASKVGGACATCTCCCVLCSLPFIFFFVGIMFPFVIMGGDFCLGMENVGYEVVAGQSGNFCSNLGGVPLGADCIIEAPNNLTVTVNLPETYTALFGSCNVNNDPLGVIWTSLNESFYSLPSHQLNKLLDGINQDNSSVTIRPPLRRVFTSMGQRTSEVVGSLITDLSGAINCQSLHSIYGTVKDAVCCDVLGSLYWALGSWYLLAWTLCCCGFPAATLARKRIPTELWGPEFEQLTKKEEAIEMDQKESLEGSISVEDVSQKAQEQVREVSRSSSHQLSESDSDDGDAVAPAHAEATGSPVEGEQANPASVQKAEDSEDDMETGGGAYLDG